MEPTQSHSNGNLAGLRDMRRMRANVEALINLIYLARREAEDAERVRYYLELADRQVASMIEVFHKDFG